MRSLSIYCVWWWWYVCDWLIVGIVLVLIVLVRIVQCGLLGIRIAIVIGISRIVVVRISWIVVIVGISLIIDVRLMIYLIHLSLQNHLLHSSKPTRENHQANPTHKPKHPASYRQIPISAANSIIQIATCKRSSTSIGGCILWIAAAIQVTSPFTGIVETIISQTIIPADIGSLYKEAYRGKEKDEGQDKADNERPISEYGISFLSVKVWL